MDIYKKNGNFSNLPELINAFISTTVGQTYLFGENGKINELMDIYKKNGNFSNLSLLVNAFNLSPDGKKYLFGENGKIDELLELNKKSKNCFDLPIMLTKILSTQEGRKYLFETDYGLEKVYDLIKIHGKKGMRTGEFLTYFVALIENYTPNDKRDLLKNNVINILVKQCFEDEINIGYGYSIENIKNNVLYFYKNRENCIDTINTVLKETYKIYKTDDLFDEEYFISSFKGIGIRDINIEELIKASNKEMREEFEKEIEQHSLNISNNNLIYEKDSNKIVLHLTESCKEKLKESGISDNDINKISEILSNNFKTDIIKDGENYKDIQKQLTSKLNSIIEKGLAKSFKNKNLSRTQSIILEKFDNCLGFGKQKEISRQ